MKVAFLANSYHLDKTRSSQFFIDLLIQWFGGVSVIAHQDAWQSLPGTRWDVLITWQHLFTPQELEAFGARNTILVPMYDDCPKEREFWVTYRGFKVLCFSETLANLVESCGVDCHRVTYWPPTPTEQADWSRGLRGFFWPRTASLDGRQIAILCGRQKWQSFHLHTGHTPKSAVLPTPANIEAVRWVESDWFEGADDYRAALTDANVFFAPRRYEGIGMAILEAMALGQCVVAPDNPTANEYIVSGQNGLLFDPDAPVQLDLSRAEELGRAVRHTAVLGRSRWEASLGDLQAFLRAVPERPRRGLHPWVALRGRSWVVLRSVYRALKSWKK